MGHCIQMCKVLFGAQPSLMLNASFGDNVQWTKSHGDAQRHLPLTSYPDAQDPLKNGFFWYRHNILHFVVHFKNKLFLVMLRK